MNSNLPNTRPTPATQRTQAYNIIGSRTLTAAHVSKLRKGNMSFHDDNATPAIKSAQSQSDMIQMAQEQYLREIDNENAIRLMPEIEWACRVLVSSILSPKDMTKRELVYGMDLEWISPSTRSAILDEIKREMTAVYDYSDSLYHIFRDCLFLKGSHPRLILPEAAVDRIINSGETLTMESLGSVFSKDGTTLNQRGLLGPRKLDKKSVGFVTMESFNRANAMAAPTNTDEGIYIETQVEENGVKVTKEVAIEGLSITDNVDAVKLGAYLQVVAEGAVRQILPKPEIDEGLFDGLTWGDEEPAGQATTEARGDASKNSNLSERDFKAAVYKAAPNNLVTHLRVPGRSDLKRRSVGRPLVMSLPPGSVIPVNAVGDVRRKVGFILLYDETGNPINPRASGELFARAGRVIDATNSGNMASNSNVASMILSKGGSNMDASGKVTTFKEASVIFSQIVNDNIVPRLMNGAFPGGVELADTADLYSLMLARTLCSMRTRMVFVHADMLTYFAFDYHENGIGRSLLDSNKMLIAIRAGILLTRMTAEMRNSIPLTKVTLKIDEDDSDWERTWDEAQHAIATTRQPQFPLNTLAVNDLMQWISRSGFLFEFENHPRMPDTKLLFEKTQHENHLPDQEFYDSLGKQLYMGMGIPAELMDATNDPEFAIAIASRSIIFTQTILEAQKTASGMITDDHHRLILSDGVMMNAITKIVRDKWGEITSKLPASEKESFSANPKRYALDLVERIIRSVRVSLPSPDATTIENQAERYRQFSDFITEVLPNFVGDDVLTADIAPELAQKLASMSGPIKAALMRDFMSRNNILPELFKISSVDEDGRPQFDLLQLLESYSSGLATNLMAFAKSMQPVEKAASDDATNMNLGNDGTSSIGGLSGGSGDSASSSSESGESTDEAGTGFDLDIPEL